MEHKLSMHGKWKVNKFYPPQKFDPSRNFQPNNANNPLNLVQKLYALSQFQVLLMIIRTYTLSIMKPPPLILTQSSNWQNIYQPERGETRNNRRQGGCSGTQLSLVVTALFYHTPLTRQPCYPNITSFLFSEKGKRSSFWLITLWRRERRMNPANGLCNYFILPKCSLFLTACTLCTTAKED